MEVVQRLPKPEDPVALSRLVDAQRLLCSRCVSEEDCEQAKALLEELAAPTESGGFGFCPALLTLASLHEAGFEPGIPKDGALAARCYLRLLTHGQACSILAADLLEEAATSLCTLVKDGRADLREEELRALDRLAKGELSGAKGSVSSWARFAHNEGERLFAEAREDPAVRQERLARKAAREAQRAQQVAEQKELAQAALAKADELRRQGNDDYRQGQMPGNARSKVDFARAAQRYGEAAEELEAVAGRLALVPEEAAEVRRQRGLLRSNAAQVQIAAENWAQAAELARAAIEDDPDGGVKPRYRLARAQAGLGAWEDAAQTVDRALSDLASGGKDADDIRLELWKLAEVIAKALPSFSWSSSKPQPKEQRPAEDFERRIVGVWEYGPPGSEQCYEVMLEQWGALYWREKEMRIDLLRKGKLRWRGEYEMVSGMVLNLSYEPGSDVLITDFTPPTDIPEEQQWKGPTKFTARRVHRPPAAQPPPPAEPAASSAPPTPAPAPPDELRGQAAQTAQEEAVEEPTGPLPLPDGTPTELWLVGDHVELTGRYDLLPDVAPPGARVGSSAVYRRAASGDGGACYLWSRGGNWCVTASLHASPMAAPFLARCPDVSGRARQPMEVRRPRWYVRKGRGQEELDASVALLASPPSGARVAAGEARPPPSASAPPDGDGEGRAEAPIAIMISGRAGRFAEVNGRYDRSADTWRRLPVYTQADHPLDQERPYVVFFDGTCWTLAPDLAAVPRAVARCRAGTVAGEGASSSAVSPPPHPAAVTGGVWEFLSSEENLGSMVTTSTRTYAADRGVSVSAVLADGGVLAPPPPKPLPVASAAPSSSVGAVAVATASSARGAGRPADWVLSASAEETDGEVRASIVVRDGVQVDLEGLDLEAAEQVLRVRLGGSSEPLELPLPAPVDVGGVGGGPRARWSERTRTLKVRLALAPGVTAATLPPAPAAASVDHNSMD